MFESLNRADDVSFRYTLFDGGTGRELQNGLIHNIAGLGIANGDRPFKRFARPMIFYPRSTIRVLVQEHFGRGRLYLVFQGYKLSAPAQRRRGAVTRQETRAMNSVAPFSQFGEALADSGRRTIPFDYAFRYQLTGSPGTVLNNTVTVSVEATFVAVSVGYGVIPEVTPVAIGLPPPPPPPPSPSPTPIEHRFHTSQDRIADRPRRSREVAQGRARFSPRVRRAATRFSARRCAAGSGSTRVSRTWR